MSYFVPYVDESGLHYPTYNDILEQLIDDYQRIYGAGIYLGNDSQDYELLSEFAEKIYDVYQSLEIAYNSHSPIKALGVGLDYIVAINGITRKQATKSTAQVTLTGAPNAVITNGAVSDSLGYMWDLPESVTLDANGTATVTAVCREAGVIFAGAETITNIMTPVSGWDSVFNLEPSTTGSVIEKDSELRARQAQTVALPSQSLITGLRAHLSAISGVKRSAVYENDTDDEDDDGVPPHSICCVVEGDSVDDEEIAMTIFNRKTPGCGTYAPSGQSTSVAKTIYDKYNQPITINFARLSYVDIDVEIHISARAGFTSSIITEMKNAIIEYLDEFSIGADLSTSIIWMITQQVNTDPRMPSFSINSIKAAAHGGQLKTGDVEIDFNKVARGNASYINVIVDT